MPLIQNFTQFATQNGYPCDYDTMFHAQLNGSAGLAGKISNRRVKELNTNFSDMQAQNRKAHQEYEAAIVKGEIIDPEGKLTKEGILKREYDFKAKEINAKITAAQSGIKFIESLGKMAHLPNGKLKKGYQRTVNDYSEKIAALELELFILNN